MWPNDHTVETSVISCLIPNVLFKEEPMFKLAATIMAATLCAGAMVPLRAEAMTSGAFAHLRAAIEVTDPIKKAACGWYPADYPQSWAVYTRGRGCRQVYSPYYYDPYLYRPYYPGYDPLWSRSRPYWRPRLWYSWY
jgi:hypothetical protein